MKKHEKYIKNHAVRLKTTGDAIFLMVVQKPASGARCFHATCGVKVHMHYYPSRFA